MHEFRIAREHGAMLNPFGWIESVKIVDAPVFNAGQKISFANTNVLVGDNGVGKTALCEWLSCLARLGSLSRWGAYSDGIPLNSNLEIEFEIRAPTRQRAILRVTRGKPSFTIDDRTFPFSPIQYEVVTVRSGRDVQVARDRGDHEYIAKRLDIDVIEVQTLAEFIASDPGVYLKGATWEDVEDEDTGNPVRYLRCRALGINGQSFRALSSGEIGAVLLDLAIARATILSSYRPTLLIVDTADLSMDSEFLSQFLNALSSPLITFQSIFVTTQLDEDAAWSGWQRICLHKKGAATEIAMG